MEVQQLRDQDTPETTLARVDRDWPLVEALRRREPIAAERLVATYGDRAYNLAVKITGSEQEAEDAVQDAFWSVVQEIDAFRSGSGFGSWLYRIVANAAYETRRRGHIPQKQVSEARATPR